MTFKMNFIKEEHEMKKRNSKMLLSFFIGAVFVLLTYSGVLAAGDCTKPNESPNTCWSFNLGYTIEVMVPGVLNQDMGLQEWSYKLSKSKNASANMIYLGIEKDIYVDQLNSDFNDYLETCEGNANENIGVGDCLRQFMGWPANFPTSSSTITYYIKPVENSTPTPIFMKGSNDTESGAILGPAADKAEVIESTFFIDQTDDGRALAVKMDRNGNIIEAWKCDADCENFPTNFDLIETPTISLSETFFCIPADGVNFIDNSDLDIGSDSITSLHCGSVEFRDVDSSIQFSNRGSCRVLPSGGLFCY
jgi:hypothetical protein